MSEGQESEPCIAAAYGNDPMPCSGEVGTYWSRSGLTKTTRCEGHQRRHEETLDEIANRYPDSSVPPIWFDTTYAGERWDDDY